MGENFPDVAVVSSYEELKQHPDYEAAKHGDNEAAADLVEELMSGTDQWEMIRELRETHPDAVLVPGHTQETIGRNKIPLLFAEAIGGGWDC
jgi:UDP-N-acetylglucosamine 2-epimerase